MGINSLEIKDKTNYDWDFDVNSLKNSFKNWC